MATKSRKQAAIRSWDDVRLFLALHRAGSLSAAAGPLGVTQPTCGRRLAALESGLGLRLFDRTPEGLRITAEGTALLEAAASMEKGASALELRASMKDRDLDGAVRIATSDLFASAFLVGALRAMRAKYPGVRVELSLSNADADLLRREADIAIRFRPHASRPTPAALVARKLGDEPFSLYGTDDYVARRGVPIDPNDLAGHDVVVFSARHPAFDWCATAFRRANVALVASSMHVVGSAIAAGIGLGVLPQRASVLFPALRPLSPVVARATAWLVVHPDMRHVPRIRLVVETIAALFRESSLH